MSPKRHHHLLDNFYVVAVVSNPVRYRSRYELFKKFQEHMGKSGIPEKNFHVMELAFAHRAFEIIGMGHGTHHHIRVPQELWYKENMINLAVSRLPSTWEYVAWIDADIEFLRDDWAIEACHQLQHHQIIQLWQNAVDHGPNGETLNVHRSFCSAYLSGETYNPGYGAHWHPGYAWACRRETFNKLGGLIDFSILGSGDHHMALALIGLAERSVPGGIGETYLRRIEQWQDRADYWVKRDIGFVPGTIRHFWHGKKRDRRYKDRWGILKKWKYDPDTDLVRDYQGVIQLNDTHSRRMTGLRDDIRAYFRGRNEDSVDAE